MLTFSVITPSFNQVDFLKENIESVLKQTIKPIEHLVFDPGSTDGSRGLAWAYENVTVIAEQDNGQSDALNKGFERAKGDIICWLNSDDFLFDEHVFEKVLHFFNENKDVDIVYGNGIYVDENGKFLRDAYINKNPDILFDRFQEGVGIMQPATFFRRRLIGKIGLLREDYHYCMDYEYWIRAVKNNIKLKYLNEKFAIASYHTNNKTYGNRHLSFEDVCRMILEHYGYVNHVWLKRYAEYNVAKYDGVLQSAGKNDIHSDQIQEEYQKLIRRYNCNNLVYQTIVDNKDKNGYSQAFKEIHEFNLVPLHCKEVSMETEYEPYHNLYKMGDRKWAYRSDWKKTQLEKSHEFFRNCIENKKSDTCIIVGNGPSLNKIDFKLFKGADVIISNNAFLSEELLNYATYYTVVNYLVAEQSYHLINKLENVNKILPFWLSYAINSSDSSYFVEAKGFPKFCTNIFENLSWRHTVSFYNMHIAFGLGYKKTILVGFDHYYVQDKKYEEGDVIDQKTDDPNHFHPKYFKNQKWQAADVINMEKMYLLAKEAFDESGKIIINSTVGGHLEVFRRLPLAEALES